MHSASPWNSVPTCTSARQSRRAHPCIPRMPQWSAQGSYDIALSISPPITGRPCYLKKNACCSSCTSQHGWLHANTTQAMNHCHIFKTKKTCALRKNARWYQRASPRSPRWNQYEGISSTPAYINLFLEFSSPAQQTNQRKI